MIGVFGATPRKLNCKKPRGANPKVKVWDFGGPWVVSVIDGVM
jgi:hypothetical protein